MYVGLHAKYTLFFSDFKGIWIFSTDFRKNLKYQILWKSFLGFRVVPCRRTDWCTDMQTEATKVIVSSRNFGKHPQKWDWKVSLYSWSMIMAPSGNLWLADWLFFYSYVSRCHLSFHKQTNTYISSNTPFCLITQYYMSPFVRTKFSHIFKNNLKNKVLFCF
jgi:hypothetical protein